MKMTMLSASLGLMLAHLPASAASVDADALSSLAAPALSDSQLEALRGGIIHAFIGAPFLPMQNLSLPPLLDLNFQSLEPPSPIHPMIPLGLSIHDMVILPPSRCQTACANIQLLPTSRMQPPT